MADIREKPPITDGPRDFKDIVTHECICGSGLFYALVCFDDYEIAGYYTEGVCYGCGGWVKLPTELDRI